MEDKYLTQDSNFIDHYEANLEEFIDFTIHTANSRYFSEKGYEIVAVNLSPTMCANTKNSWCHDLHHEGGSP